MCFDTFSKLKLNLFISSLTGGISKSRCGISFVTYHGVCFKNAEKKIAIVSSYPALISRSKSVR